MHIFVKAFKDSSSQTYGHQQTQQTQIEEPNVDRHKFYSQQPSQKKKNLTLLHTHNYTTKVTFFQQNLWHGLKN